MRLLVKILLVAMTAIFLLYISRFWPVELWPRRGVLAGYGLRPQGGLLQVWLRGTMFSPFELIIWVVVGFMALTWVEKICAVIGPKPVEPTD